MQGEWIRRSSNGTSVVFVHGLLSSGEKCWLNENQSYWPHLLRDEAHLAEIGIYVYTYQTEIFSGQYQLSDVVDDLKERMWLDGLIDQDRIIFVGHSMGGIVARRLLVERQSDLIEKNKEIGLFLVASPSLGSKYANLIEGFADWLGHAQSKALKFSQDNTWLNDLDEDFLNLKESKRLRIHGKELVEHKFVVKSVTRRQVVERFSGARYFSDPYKVPKSDHFSIAKPVDRGAIQHRLLCNFINDILKQSSDANAETDGESQSARMGRGQNGMGIKARIIKARHVGTMQVHASPSAFDSSDIDRWLDSAGSLLESGATIEADTIEATGDVGIFQFFADAEKPQIEELVIAIAALREEFKTVIETEPLTDDGDRKDIEKALEEAAAEARKQEPNGRRVKRHIKQAAEIIKVSAETAKSAKTLGADLAKLAPKAAVLYRLATAYFGG